MDILVIIMTQQWLLTPKTDPYSHFAYNQPEYKSENWVNTEETQKSFKETG